MCIEQKGTFCPLGRTDCRRCCYLNRKYSPEKKKVAGKCELEGVARQFVTDQKGGA